MISETIRNERGQPIAYIKDDEVNRVEITDTRGWPLGYYYLNENKTSDAQGRFIGYGNQLMRLVPR